MTRHRVGEITRSWKRVPTRTSGESVTSKIAIEIDEHCPWNVTTLEPGLGVGRPSVERPPNIRDREAGLAQVGVEPFSADERAWQRHSPRIRRGWRQTLSGSRGRRRPRTDEGVVRNPLVAQDLWK